MRTSAIGASSVGALMALAQRLAAQDLQALLPKSKVRVGKVYLGRANPGWPMSTVDLDAEVKRYEQNLAKLAPSLADVEFVDAGLVESGDQIGAAKQALAGVDGILAIHLTLGTGPNIKSLLELGIPTVVFTLPYSGHEWHTVAGLQREGKLVEVYPTSRYEDIALAIRPFRALHRLREAVVLHVSQHDADPQYVKAIKDKFGTEIKSLKLADLEEAWNKADDAEAVKEAEQWVRGAMRVVEPKTEDVVKAGRMYLAMRDMMKTHKAAAITMNCLGMGLMDRGMGYPCLGFVRFSNAGLGGICEADLKSTLTHMIFAYLVGRPGFITDPVIDVSTSTIIHAHCVAPTRMLGTDGPAAQYAIRSHLEDNRGAVLQVKLPTGGRVSMARLIGTDLMLFSTGEAVDSPFVDRACRTKLTMKVENIDKFVENWSCGLHRVVFYGDHTRDVRRFCRFAKIRILTEGVDDLKDVPGLEWDTNVHA